MLIVSFLFSLSRFCEVSSTPFNLRFELELPNLLPRDGLEERCEPRGIFTGVWLSEDLIMTSDGLAKLLFFKELDVFMCLAVWGLLFFVEIDSTVLVLAASLPWLVILLRGVRLLRCELASYIICAVYNRLGGLLRPMNVGRLLAAISVSKSGSDGVLASVFAILFHTLYYWRGSREFFADIGIDWGSGAIIWVRAEKRLL